MKKHMVFDTCSRFWLSVGYGGSSNLPDCRGDKAKFGLHRSYSRRLGQPKSRLRARSMRISAALGDPRQRQCPRTGGERSARDQLGRWRYEDTTTAPVTPFNVFLNTRGGQFTTLGK